MKGIASWLALSKAPHIGPIRFKNLLARYKSPERVFAAVQEGAIDRKLLPQKTLEYLQSPNWRAVDRELDWLRQIEHHVLLLGQGHYPRLLMEVADAPAVLYCIGDPTVLSQVQLAIVGSRHPTHAGLEHAFDFSRSLCEAGFNITSGLAMGIDSAAHRGALRATRPTVAVLAHGLDTVYPRENGPLAAAIVQDGGLLISELGLGMAPARHFFPRRNRIISGLGVGTLVIEAGVRSGALTTAQHALDQGREVFALPGSINNPLARGCNRLIRGGAKLVETIEHILEEFEFGFRLTPADNRTELNSAADLKSQSCEVLEYIGYEPTSVDVIISRSGKSADWVTAKLLEMELQGLVSLLPGGKFILA